MDIKDAEFEAVIMKIMMDDSELLSKLAPHITDNLFINKEYARCAKVCNAYYTKFGKLVDDTHLLVMKSVPDDVKATFFDTKKQLTRVNPHGIPRETLIQYCEDWLKSRKIWTTIVDISTKLKSGDLSPEDVSKNMVNICNISIDDDIGVSIAKDPERVREAITKTTEGLSTGYPSIDATLSAQGYQADGRALYVIAGRPNVGKSIILGNLAVNLANQGKTVVVVSFEMSEDSYVARFCSSLSTVKLGDLKNDPDTVIQDLGTMAGDIIVKEFPPSRITPERLEVYLHEVVKAGHNIDAIVIDYLNLMTDNDPSMYIRVKMIAEKLRALSYVFSCPVITATQLNRSGWGDGASGMESVSESAGVAMTADVMWNIFRPKGVENTMMLTIMRNRIGVVNDIPIRFDIDIQHMKLVDMGEDKNVLLHTDDLSDLSSLLSTK